MTDTVDLSALRGWIDILHEANAQKKRCEEAIATARAKIEEALGDLEVGCLDDTPVVRYTHVTSTRFDTSKAKKLLPADLYQACTSTTTTRRFTLVDQEQS